MSCQCECKSVAGEVDWSDLVVDLGGCEEEGVWECLGVVVLVRSIVLLGERDGERGDYDVMVDF